MKQQIYNIICIILIFCFISVPSFALNLIVSDYDNDKWIEESISLDIPENIQEGWYPLKAVSAFLPIDVSWDESTREVVVYSHELARTNIFYDGRRYKANCLPSNLKIVDGTTYCSPQFLTNNLSGRSFIYDGKVHYFTGEKVKSKLIKANGNSVFKDNVITSMYQLKLKSPDDYAFVRKHLSGGIEYATKQQVPQNAFNAVAYTYPYRKKPVCYIIRAHNGGATLASYIAHEAYHIYECKTNGDSTEKAAKEYQKQIFIKQQFYK